MNPQSNLLNVFDDQLKVIIMMLEPIDVLHVSLVCKHLNEFSDVIKAYYATQDAYVIGDVFRITKSECNYLKLSEHNHWSLVKYTHCPGQCLMHALDHDMIESLLRIVPCVKAKMLYNAVEMGYIDIVSHYEHLFHKLVRSALKSKSFEMYEMIVDKMSLTTESVELICVGQNMSIALDAIQYISIDESCCEYLYASGNMELTKLAMTIRVPNEYDLRLACDYNNISAVEIILGLDSTLAARVKYYGSNTEIVEMLSKHPLANGWRNYVSTVRIAYNNGDKLELLRLLDEDGSELDEYDYFNIMRCFKDDVDLLPSVIGKMHLDNESEQLVIEICELGMYNVLDEVRNIICVGECEEFVGACQGGYLDRAKALWKILKGTKQSSTVGMMLQTFTNFNIDVYEFLLDEGIIDAEKAFNRLDFNTMHAKVLVERLGILKLCCDVSIINDLEYYDKMYVLGKLGVTLCSSIRYGKRFVLTGNQVSVQRCRLDEFI